MPVTITVRKNGSLGITADDAANLRLVDHDGVELELPAGKGVSLCRCGHSARMPFCDASHKTSGWESGEIHCRREPAPDVAGSTDAPAAPSA
jgi:CDGSH-type Zn-finger protein